MFDELFDDIDEFVEYMKANDSQEVRGIVLRTDRLRFWCCKGVCDREGVWSKIADPEWAYKYCKWVVDRPEVWSKITDPDWAYMYCIDVCDRPEVRKYV